MYFEYKPKSQLEKFGQKVYAMLVDNFPQTFYVGGIVRDLLLHRPIDDIDIATQAMPDQVIKILRGHNTGADAKNKQFGIVIAKNRKHNIEIATFRQDKYGNSRYPKINFVKTPKQDSQRRDFTINALYLSPKLKKVTDFHSGISDLKKKTLRFIRDPSGSIKEDPLRIIRALRFCLDLNFSLEGKTQRAIKMHFYETKKLTASRLQTELKKIKTEKNKKIILHSLENPKLLDIIFKSL